MSEVIGSGALVARSVSGDAVASLLQFTLVLQIRLPPPGRQPIGAALAGSSRQPQGNRIWMNSPHFPLVGGLRPPTFSRWVADPA